MSDLEGVDRALFLSGKQTRLGFRVASLQGLGFFSESSRGLSRQVGGITQNPAGFGEFFMGGGSDDTGVKWLVEVK